jgi:hypothetical protein
VGFPGEVESSGLAGGESPFAPNLHSSQTLSPFPPPSSVTIKLNPFTTFQVKLSSEQVLAMLEATSIAIDLQKLKASKGLWTGKSRVGLLGVINSLVVEGQRWNQGGHIPCKRSSLTPPTQNPPESQADEDSDP